MIICFKFVIKFKLKIDAIDLRLSDLGCFNIGVIANGMTTES